MITVVPLLLIRSSSAMMPALVEGSRFPVGSSASRMAGRLTMARAMATRCCSPPESSVGSLLALPASPTIFSTSGTASWMKPLLLPMTWREKATLANTVFCGSSRKSWNTTPMLRRKYGTLRLLRLRRLRPSTWICPEVGLSSFSTRRRKVDLPLPDAPTRKTNSPRRISRVTESSAGLVFRA